MELSSPPASPPQAPVQPPASPDRGGVVFLRKELNSTRHQVRELIGSVDSLSTALASAQTEIERLRAENAALRRRGAGELRTHSSAPAGARAQADAWGVVIDLRKSDSSGCTDPVAVLGPELSALIFLKVQTDRVACLHRWCRVSVAWDAALRDDALWRPLCESTWSSWRWPQLAASDESSPRSGMWRQWFTNAHWSASERGITAEELVRIRWRFEFKDDQSGLKEATAQFFEDGTFVSTVPSAPSGRRPLPYQLCIEKSSLQQWNSSGGGEADELQAIQASSAAEAAPGAEACKFVQGERPSPCHRCCCWSCCCRHCRLRTLAAEAHHRRCCVLSRRHSQTLPATSRLPSRMALETRE